MTKENPKFAEFKQHLDAYLDSVKNENDNELLMKELNTVVPGLFMKYFPERFKKNMDLDGLVIVKEVSPDLVDLKIDGDLVRSLKYMS
jgi:hypothetical protein